MKILGADGIVKTTDITRDEWLKWRKQGIGGSDAGAILGLNPYSSAFQVYCDKKGLLPEQEDNEAMRQGRDFEEYVAKRFMEEKGLKVKRCNYLVQNPEKPFMLADVDRLLVCENIGLECKTASAMSKVDYAAGEIPPQYYAQCVHYMAVTGAASWYIAILVFSRGFYVYRIDRDEDEIKALIERERDFWYNNVLTNIEPAADGSERAGKVIQHLYKGNDAEPPALLHGYENNMTRIKELDTEIKALTKEQDTLKQVIQLKMRDAITGMADGYTVKFAPQSRTTVDSKALKADNPDIFEKYSKISTFRKFEIKPTKEIL